MKTSSPQTGNRLHSVFGDVEKVFHHLFESPGGKPALQFHPRWNVVERTGDFQLTVELPGVAPEAVNVEFEDGVLSVSGEKMIKSLAEGDQLHHSERVGGEFKRTIEFTTPVDFEKIDASFSNGLLEITVPKSAKALPRKIEIKSN